MMIAKDSWEWYPHNQLLKWYYLLTDGENNYNELAINYHYN